jgi:ribose transport system permease protein
VAGPRPAIGRALVCRATVAGEAGLIADGLLANPQAGPGYTLSALAAASLGSTTIHPGRFNVPGTIVGVFFVAVSVIADP